MSVNVGQKCWVNVGQNDGKTSVRKKMSVRASEVLVNVGQNDGKRQSEMLENVG